MNELFVVGAILHFNMYFYETIVLVLDIFRFVCTLGNFATILQHKHCAYLYPMVFGS